MDHQTLDSEEVHLRGKNNTTDRRAKKGLKLQGDRRGVRALRDDEDVPEIDLREEEADKPKIKFKKLREKKREDIETSKLRLSHLLTEQEKSVMMKMIDRQLDKKDKEGQRRSYFFKLVVADLMGSFFAIVGLLLQMFEVGSSSADQGLLLQRCAESNDV